MTGTYPGVTFEPVLGAPGTWRVHHDGVYVGTLMQFRRRFVALDAAGERLGSTNSEARTVGKLLARAGVEEGTSGT